MLLFSAYLHLKQGAGTQPDILEHRLLDTRANCDIVSSPCPGYSDELSISLYLKDKPGALKPFPVEVSVTQAANLQIQKVLISFTMKGMSMGEQAHKLKLNTETGRWQGMVILPICATGRRDWHARLELVSTGVIFEAGYNFVLQ